MHTPLLRDERAQALEIGVGLLTIVGLGILYAFTDPIWQDLHAAGSTHLDGKTGAKGLVYMDQIWTNLPLIFVLVVAIGVIALAVFRKPGV